MKKSARPSLAPLQEDTMQHDYQGMISDLWLMALNARMHITLDGQGHKRLQHAQRCAKFAAELETRIT